MRTFWFLRNDEPVLLCVACWIPRSAADAFGIAERAYYDLLLQCCCAAPDLSGALPEHAPAMPTNLPWLVRVILPGVKYLKPRESIVLDELERCLAWTLLKRSVASR
jgi:hypothetical protein